MSPPQPNDGTQLRVAGALLEDVGRELARLDADDLVTGAAAVILAAGAGKRAAPAIHESLAGCKRAWSSSD